MATKNNIFPTPKKRDKKCGFFCDQPSPDQSIICHPDFFVERLRYQCSQTFKELLLSNISRLIDLPGDEFCQLSGDSDPKLPSTSIGFLRSFNFLKRKENKMVFGAPLTEEGIAQIYQLIEFLSKIFLGELPEPLLTHRHYHAHLKIGELTRFDEKGDKTNVPDKERQIEAFQLLFLLLPQANRSFLKLLLDLLYHTARNQHINKMSAINLAKMFAPHIIWPKNAMASDLQGNMEKLNNGVAFLIRHSQKLFEAPHYIKDYARLYFMGPKARQSNDDSTLSSGSNSQCFGSAPHGSEAFSLKTNLGRTSSTSTSDASECLSYTDSALKELYEQVNSMPESAKKKKLIRKFQKEPRLTSAKETETPLSRRHERSSSFNGVESEGMGSVVLPGKENNEEQNPASS